MPLLPGFWHAAASLSGRLDLNPVLQAGVPRARIAQLSAVRLAGCGVAIDHAARLVDTPPLPDVGPFISFADAAYPSRLGDIECPPPVLFAWGDVALLDQPAVAIVGSRRCTADGRRMARRLSRAAVAAGAVVVSGLAHGIDTEAHVAAQGRTIAVLGQGLRARFTVQQGRLARQIVDGGGLLLSEFLPEQPGARYTFPQRNRIIAGLGRVTVVVEAGVRSGALITARQAASAGREVLVVPGHPLAEQSAGCLRLLRDGASLLITQADLLDALKLSSTRDEARPLDPLIQALGAGRTVEQLARDTGQAPVALVRRLAVLELTGLVQRLPGDRYGPRG